MSVVQVIIDRSATETYQGVKIFDRENGGTFVGEAGAAFPGTPVAGEWFWRTDESKLYRRNDTNTAWDSVVSAIAAHRTTHEPGGTDALTVDAAAATGSLRTVGTGALQACAGNDARLSDARTPVAHKTSHEPGGSDALTVDAAAITGSLRTIGTGALQACAGNDGRLSDARTPTAHKTSHEPGGTDALTVDAAAATGSLRTLGTGALQACAGNDSRLSDNRTDANAIHKNVASEISTITEKTTPVSADLLIIEDSAAAGAKKKVQIGNLPGGSGTDVNAIHKNVANEISTITAKSYTAMADLLVIEDSEASGAKKKIQACQLLSSEPCYFTNEAWFFDDFWVPVLDDQWSTAASGTGSGVTLIGARGGQIRVRAGNAAGRSAELLFGGAVAWHSLSYSPRMRLRGKYNGVTNGVVELELLWTDASNYAWLRSSGGNWFLETANAGTVTSVDTGVANDTAWHIFELRGTASSVMAYIDGALVATSTTNLPTGLGTCSMYVAATGTGGTKDFLIDAFQYRCPREP